MSEGTRTTCPYCGVGCGVVATADGRVAGDPAHPANFGRLCSKGAALGETLGDSGRLLQPKIHGRPATWDAALDLVARRFAGTIAEHGPDSVAFYVSGQCLTEDYYVANKLMKGFFGSGNIDTNSRLCMASSVAGHVRAFGEDVVPGTYEDLDAADLVVLVGSNAAWCHPVLFGRIAAARETRGTRVVVVDPRRTATCDGADRHLALRAGSDVALFAGLLAHLADMGAVHRDWVARHTSGLEDALAAARGFAGSVEAVAALTDLAPADIRAFYEDFAATERVVTVYSQGVNQSSAGTDKVNAILNCHFITARIGRPGMGPFSVTGQPNAMGGREVGGLANQLAAHMSFASPEDLDRVRRFWKAPRLARDPGLKAVDLFEAVADGRVRAVWIMATNPAASLPRAGRVADALAACRFVVVSEAWEQADTAEFATVLLPAATWGEKDGTVTNSERRISRQRPFRRPPGQARPDWWMLAEVARRMGWAAAFAYAGPADIFREHARLSAFENGGRRAFDIGALTHLSDAAYDRLEPVQWPVRDGAAPGGRLFGDGRFMTPDRRARFVPTPWRPPARRPDPVHPFVLNTGRIRDQWHTMTRTGRVPRLMVHSPEPTLAINPEDAARLGVTEGGLVRVRTRSASAILKARLAPEQRPGDLFAPMHWTARYASAGPIDRLVDAALDPISGQPELKGTPARIEPLPTRWRGLLVRRAEGALPPGTHWSRIPVGGGQAYELAGWRDLPEGAEFESWIARLLGRTPEADAVELSDPARGVFRIALTSGGRLEACLFLAPPSGTLPERRLMAQWLAEAVDESIRAGLLLGDRRAGRKDDGAIVCACRAVGADRIRREIRARRLSTVAEVGAALGAGTNCGSCIPEIRELLRKLRPAA